MEYYYGSTGLPRSGNYSTDVNMMEKNAGDNPYRSDLNEVMNIRNEMNDIIKKGDTGNLTEKDIIKLHDLISKSMKKEESMINGLEKIDRNAILHTQGIPQSEQTSAVHTYGELAVYDKSLVEEDLSALKNLNSDLETNFSYLFKGGK